MDRLRRTLAYGIGLVFLMLVNGCATDRSAVQEPPAPAPAPVPMAEVPAPAPAPVTPPPPPQVESPASGPVLYKLWYATNRVPVVAKGEVLDYGPKWDNNTIHYGNIFAEIPEDFLKKMNNSGWRPWQISVPETKLRLTKPTEIDAQVFIDELKKNLQGTNSAERQVLIYLHGFNTTFKEAAQRAASIGYQLKLPATAFFSWPSQGGVANYLADKDMAELSEDNIADFIIKAYAESGAKRVHLIAHSMGNHALLGAMRGQKMQEAIRNGLHFGQVILAAPDVETQRFKKDVGVFSGISERVSVYVSDGDKALNLSKHLAAGIPRAGLRPPIVVVQHVDTVDVSSTNLTLLGHAYVSQEITVLNDMYDLILHNDAPANRIHIVKKNNYWALE